jgi:predicted secreted protein
MRVRIGSALRLAAAGSALAACLAPTGLGAEPGDYTNRVHFEVERSRDVANDWVQAVVGITDEDLDPAELADRVNRTMAWALETARDKSGVVVKSGGYRTVPVHEKGKLRRWRASQDLILEGAEVRAISDLVGELQSRLQLRSIAFTVSPQRRRATEDELIDEVLDAFKARAERVRENLGASAYQLIEISIDTGGAPPVRPLRAEMVRAVGAAEVAPPALEGGSSRLVVRAHASIELE